MDFSGKIALVTGAAVGIGRATALKLAKHGAKIILVDVDPEKLNKIKAEVEAFTSDVLACKCDVSNEASVQEVITQATSTFGRVDILVNNAALWRVYKPFTETTFDEWRRLMDVNVLGTVYFTRAVIDGMIKNRYGRIINVASVAGVYGIANMTAYSSTKGAIIAFTRSLAKEVADKGILVNSVSPGSVSPSDNPDMDYHEPSEHAFMGRTGTDNENANLICFLAGDEATYISGQSIQIDGCRKKQ